MFRTEQQERETVILEKKQTHEACPTLSHTFYHIKEVEAKKSSEETELRVQTWEIRVAETSGICEACYQRTGSQVWR